MAFYVVLRCVAMKIVRFQKNIGQMKTSAVSLSPIVRFAKHLAILYRGRAAFAPCRNVVCVHIL